MEHLGREHNKVLRYVSHFQGKNVKMVFNANLEGFKPIPTDALDPLAQDPLAVTPEELNTEAPEVISPGSKAAAKKPGRKQMDKQTTASKVRVDNSESLWVGRLKKFAEQQEGSLQMMLDGDFKDVASKVVGKFLETLSSDVEVEEAVRGLAKFCPGLQESRAVIRSKLVRAFRAYCLSHAIQPASLPAMQTVILLSQLLGKPGATPGDLQPVLEAVGKLTDSQNEPLVVEFFKSISQPLPAIEKNIELSNGALNLKKDGMAKQDSAGISNVTVGDEKARSKLLPVKEEGRAKLGSKISSIPPNSAELPVLPTSQPDVSSEQREPPDPKGGQTSAGKSPEDHVPKLLEVKKEPVLVAMTRRQEFDTGLDPECITLEEEDEEMGGKDYRFLALLMFGLVNSSYRFLCLDCEGERGCKGATCMHTTHPRYAKKYN